MALWLCKWGNTAWNRTSTPYDWGYHLCHCGPQTSLSAVKLLLGPGVFSQWLNEPRPPMVWGGCARKKQEEMFLWPGDRNGKYHTILKPGTCFGTTVTTLVGMAKNNRWSQPIAFINPWISNSSICTANPWSQNQGHDQGYIMKTSKAVRHNSHYPKKKGLTQPVTMAEFFRQQNQVTSNTSNLCHEDPLRHKKNVACHRKSLPTQVIPSSNHTPL